MAITWTNVSNIAPELATVPIGMQTEILADTLLMMSPTVWGSKFDMGRKYLAAHLATLDRRRGAGGMLAGQTVGAVSRTFAAPSSSNFYSTTSYGQTYQEILKTLGGARFDVA